MEQKAFDAGKLYYDMSNYSSAVVSLENMLKDFPGSDKEEEVRYLIAKSSYDLAINSIYTRQEERYNQTIDKCDVFIKKHPESDFINEILKFRSNSQEAIKNLE